MVDPEGKVQAAGLAWLQWLAKELIHADAIGADAAHVAEARQPPEGELGHVEERGKVRPCDIVALTSCLRPRLHHAAPLAAPILEVPHELVRVAHWLQVALAWEVCLHADAALNQCSGEPALVDGMTLLVVSLLLRGVAQHLVGLVDGTNLALRLIAVSGMLVGVPLQHEPLVGLLDAGGVDSVLHIECLVVVDDIDSLRDKPAAEAWVKLRIHPARRKLRIPQWMAARNMPPCALARNPNEQATTHTAQPI
mmetsp:Transcript_98750/g.274812  ORF Transcript_98750/g.274812 Transcript_98750/m.274812 type:complete len:252 (-) Transcript_98750:17-772(-)